MKKKVRKKGKTSSEKYFDKLIATGKKKGFLTYEEINKHLPEDIIAESDIEKVFTVLDNENIAIVDSKEEYKEKKKALRAEKTKANAAKRTATSETVSIEDPVKMYQIGRASCRERV